MHQRDRGLDVPRVEGPVGVPQELFRIHASIIVAVFGTVGERSTE
jgi:hypothetical protein